MEEKLLNEIRIWVKTIAWELTFLLPFIILAINKYLRE